MRINSATAWKEHAHKLSEKAIDRIAAEGIPTRIEAVRKAALALKNKFNLRVIPDSSIQYNLNKTERARLSPQIKLNNARVLGKDGVISLRKLLNDIDNNLALYHEALEKNYADKINKHTLFGLGHNNAGVLVQERRLINQTGLANKPNLISELRKARGEHSLINDYLHNKERIKPIDYKITTKNINRIPIIKGTNKVNENINDALTKTAKEGLNRVRNMHKRYARIKKAGEIRGIQHPLKLYENLHKIGKERQSLRDFAFKNSNNHNKEGIQKYVTKRYDKIKEYYKPYLETLEEVNNVRF